MQTFLVVIVYLIKRSTLSAEHRLKYDRLQKLRASYDQAFERWEPHVTLIPPFKVQVCSSTSPSDPTSATESYQTADGRATEEATNVATEEAGQTLLEIALSPIYAECQRVCVRKKKHIMELSQIGTFRLKSYTTLHLRPGHTSNDGMHGTERLMQLQKDLQAALKALCKNQAAIGSAKVTGPEEIKEEKTESEASKENYTPPSHFKSDSARQSFSKILEDQRSKRSAGRSFTPHLTLGQYNDRGWKSDATKIWREAEELVDAKLEEGLKAPITAVIDKIQIMWKEPHDQSSYTVWKEVQLAD